MLQVTFTTIQRKGDPMARCVARLKMGYYPLPESEGAKRRELLEFTGPASVVDPCVWQGTALDLLTQGAEVRRYGVELDAERAQAATAIRSDPTAKTNLIVTTTLIVAMRPSLV
jgi:hypothetical protein